MPISAVAKNFRDGVLTLADGTGSPIILTVQYEPGDISLTGLGQGTTAYEVAKYTDRGDFYTARKTNQSYPAFSFTAHATDYSDATQLCLPDVVRKLGGFSAGVSGLGSSADVWTIKTVTLTIEGTNFGDSTDHTIVGLNLLCTIDFAEGDPNTFTISGEFLGTVTIT